VKYVSTASVIIASSLLLWGGCKDEGTGPGRFTKEGLATITVHSTDPLPGFSFEYAAVMSWPFATHQLPDFAVLVQINATGRAIGVYLVRPDSLVPAFCLLRQFGSIDTASSYFHGLAEIPDTTYADLALSINPNQVWAIKTRRDTFAKILIRQTTAYIDSSLPGTPSPYGEVTFEWVYQPNGTRQF
jgi:hypothetical protein